MSEAANAVKFIKSKGGEFLSSKTEIVGKKTTATQPPDPLVSALTNLKHQLKTLSEVQGKTS